LGALPLMSNYQNTSSETSFIIYCRGHSPLNAKTIQSRNYLFHSSYFVLWFKRV
jgi:hypothetical protein